MDTAFLPFLPWTKLRTAETDRAGAGNALNPFELSSIGFTI
jgi:hypothetical protein